MYMLLSREEIETALCDRRWAEEARVGRPPPPSSLSIFILFFLVYQQVLAARSVRGRAYERSYLV